MLSHVVQGARPRRELSHRDQTFERRHNDLFALITRRYILKIVYSTPGGFLSKKFKDSLML